MKSAEQWIEMKQLCQHILDLSLDDEQAVTQLIELQEKQEQLREKLELELVNGIESQPPFDMQELLQLELQIQRKLSRQRDELAGQIQNFKQVGRIKTLYENTYPQTEGYYIDKQK